MHGRRHAGGRDTRLSCIPHLGAHEGPVSRINRAKRGVALPFGAALFTPQNCPCFSSFVPSAVSLLISKLCLSAVTSISHLPSKMGKKRVLVSYGVDIDAVAGWLGSYGGEDSTSDISRGGCALSSLNQLLNEQRSLGWSRRHTPSSEALRQVQDQGNMVHSRPFARHVPRGVRSNTRWGP